MTDVWVEVTEEDIAMGRREVFDTNPLLSALTRALGKDRCNLIEDRAEACPEFPVWVSSVRMPDGGRVKLPRQCQYFLAAWEYGPMGGQPLAIRNSAGQVVGGRTYCEIVRPFRFRLQETGF